MISSGELYDLSGEINSANTERLREITRDLIDNTHRLKDLIGEICDFRSSKENDVIMEKLNQIKEKMGMT